MTRCVYCQVSGRVQGVGFRAAARDAAQRLSLTGWVRNSADGKVEVLACGADDALDSFCGWLAKGPDYARVMHVERVWREAERHAEFSIRG